MPVQRLAVLQHLQHSVSIQEGELLTAPERHISQDRAVQHRVASKGRLFCSSAAFIALVDHLDSVCFMTPQTSESAVSADVEFITRSLRVYVA